MNVERQRPLSSHSPQVYIHVGMRKTATTMLQNHLFVRHPQVAFLGKFNNSPHKGFRIRSVRAAMTALLRGDVPVDRTDAAALRGMADEARRDRKPLVISCETIAAGSMKENRRRALQFKEIFTDAQILLVLREPFAFLESLYFEQLKAFNLDAKSYPLLAQKLGADPPYYFDINRWLDSIWDPKISNELRFAEKADQYADVFGRDRVSVMLFDPVDSDSRSFIGKVSDWLGINPAASAGWAYHFAGWGLFLSFLCRILRKPVRN